LDDERHHLNKEAPFGALAMMALGIFGGRENFKMFKAKRNSSYFAALASG
jgi:hypothetical protein